MYFTPKRSTDRVHAGQTSAVSLVKFSEQMAPVQRDVIESEARSASRAAAGRLTADSRRSSQGFPPTCRQPSAASMQGFAFTDCCLALCYVSVESCMNQDQFAGAVHVYSGSSSVRPHCVHSHLFKLCTASGINWISLIRQKRWQPAGINGHSYLSSMLHCVFRLRKNMECHWWLSFMYKAVSQQQELELWHLGKWKQPNLFAWMSYVLELRTDFHKRDALVSTLNDLEMFHLVDCLDFLPNYPHNSPVSS